MSEAVKSARPYDSPRRRAQAAETRRHVVAAARTLFERDGYVATSMPAIAAEAGVALKTAYLAFGTKAALLRAVWDLRLAGDEAGTSVLERRWYREALAAQKPDDVLRLLARQSATVKGRSGRLLEAIRNAASVDPEIAELWSEIQTKLHDVANALTSELFRRGVLQPHLKPAGAADIVWALNHPAMWQLLVGERGWSADRYEKWLANAFCSQLLEGPREH
jgi:AcrR family transcriptional regulator